MGVTTIIAPAEAMIQSREKWPEKAKSYKELAVKKRDGLVAHDQYLCMPVEVYEETVTLSQARLKELCKQVEIWEDTREPRNRRATENWKNMSSLRLPLLTKSTTRSTTTPKS